MIAWKQGLLDQGESLLHNEKAKRRFLNLVYEWVNEVLPDPPTRVDVLVLENAQLHCFTLQHGSYDNQTKMNSMWGLGLFNSIEHVNFVSVQSSK